SSRRRMIWVAESTPSPGIAEAGPTAATFPSGKHLSSWVGACPGHVLSDNRVQKELDRHPVNCERLLKALRRVPHFKFNSAQVDHFMWVFSRYGQPTEACTSEQYEILHQDLLGRTI